MVARYIPDRGDIVWLSFDLRLGHEQAGKRPALVLTPKSYNQKTQLMLACPITSKIKGYPFELAVESASIMGVVLTDQMRSLDWVAREVSYAAKITPVTLMQVQEHITALIMQ